MVRFPFPCYITLLSLLLILFARLNVSSSSQNEYSSKSTDGAITKPGDISLTQSPEHHNEGLDPLDEPIYDIKELEAILEGNKSIHKRKFVTLEKVGRKMVERPYKFRTRGKPRKARESIPEKYNLDNETVHRLKNISIGFSSNTVYIRYDTKKLSALELTGDTKAELGDPCRATNIMAYDYCERAAFPNKGKMVCNTVKDVSKALVPNTCICKYYRMHPKTPKWKQLPVTHVNLTLNGETQSRRVCLIPQGGVCNHRISTGLSTTKDKAIYEVDVCRGHFQCDNRKFLNGVALHMRSYCSEKEFLEKFDPKDKDHVLLCAKPHSRQFSEYDEYKYYCLPQHLQAPDDEYRNSMPPNTAYDADEKEEEDML
ncbi:unnamed protein product [Orchesella dallaii]|uniref:Uncharacterized protein n=1 Tax=Orchesella dallaii TaxID=48710 RepID=A0ABP1PNI4_9HEXA